MAEKRKINKLLAGFAAAIAFLLLFLTFSNDNEEYQAIDKLPEYEESVKRKDGDTQADTIKALQAYAREAVNKANSLNKQTKTHATQVLDNKNSVNRLKDENRVNKEALDKTSIYTKELEKHIKRIESELDSIKENQKNNKPRINEEGIPVGFGFDGVVKKNKSQTGKWHDPIDLIVEENGDGENNRFTGLLSRTNQFSEKNRKNTTGGNKEKPKEKVIPAYTLPKDATLTDSLAMTALIGRIPVEGITPDPYPVKIFIGKENLTANGHELPEVEGMVFSGLGFGDWNLSCVSVRLYSATYIFEDGTIVNHSEPDTSLGYISDESGVPCVSGEFVTNAPEFILQRVGLSGLGVAGSAYAEAQTQTQTSSLTGTTTSSVIGDIDKLVAGNVVKSATDEVSQWLLERQKQSFDAVFVKPGASVSVHLQKTLTIDHREFGRKLRYATGDGGYENTLD